MLSTGLLLLLSLFWLPVEVFCQIEFPYASFMGEQLRSHSYVNLSLIGHHKHTAGEGVHCHTDLSTCCSSTQGEHHGDWHFPNGTRLPHSGFGDTY